MTLFFRCSSGVFPGNRNCSDGLLFGSGGGLDIGRLDFRGVDEVGNAGLIPGCGFEPYVSSKVVSMNSSRVDRDPARDPALPGRCECDPPGPCTLLLLPVVRLVLSDGPGARDPPARDPPACY